MSLRAYLVRISNQSWLYIHRNTSDWMVDEVVVAVVLTSIKLYIHKYEDWLLCVINIIFNNRAQMCFTVFEWKIQIFIAVVFFCRESL